MEKEFTAMRTMETVKDAIMAMARDEPAEAKRILDLYVSTGDVQELARASLVLNAWHIRIMIGDPDPTGEPKGSLSSTMLAFDKVTGMPANATEEEFAFGAIMHAANWDWPRLDEMMQERIDQAKGDDQLFMKQFTGTLINIFVALDGPERVGWIK